MHASAAWRAGETNARRVVSAESDACSIRLALPGDVDVFTEHRIEQFWSSGQPVATTRELSFRDGAVVVDSG